MSYTNIFPLYKSYLTSFSSSTSKPSSFEQAIKDSSWIQAINQEIQSLNDDRTWEIVDLLLGKTPIGCKLVYKIKCKVDGSIKRYKARLVAKGFTQKEGLDYHDTFSLIVKMITVRCVITLIAQYCWQISQMDVYNAFLQGDLFDEVYMVLPPRFNS